MNSTVTYLNTAACGLVPEIFTEEAARLYTAMAADASSNAERWRDDVLPSVRERVAAFLGTTDDTIALLPNFSWGINGIVQSLNGDEKVMLYTKDYPSLLLPFEINHFDITWIEDEDGFLISTEKIKQTIKDKRINILAISHVQWESGFKADIKELGRFCKENDVLFIVDATQSMGAVDINVSELEVDVLIGSNYKWMNAGFGTGIMYASQDFLQKYTPSTGGNNSCTIINGKRQYIPSVRSYEPGHPNMYGLAVLDAAISHKQVLNMPKVEDYNRVLTQMLLEGIKGMNVTLIGEAATGNRSSIVFFKEENGLFDKLKQNNIIVSLRGNVRISMHYTNTEADVHRLLDVLQQV